MTEPGAMPKRLLARQLREAFRAELDERVGAAEMQVATPRPAQAEALTTALSAQLPAELGALHQGALAFERWFARGAPVGTMRGALVSTVGG